MIEVPVAVGELLDKISILEIKQARITDPGKLANVARELEALQAVSAREVAKDARIDALCAALRQVNEALWDIEDAIREQERKSEFDAKFIELARSVYQTNDRRAALKRQLNEATGSALVEEKSYSAY